MSLPSNLDLPCLTLPRATLLAAVASMGGVPVDLGIVKDKEATLKGAVEAALEHCDVLVTSGGVSMGEADLLKPILEVGAYVEFCLAWRAMQLSV